MINYTTKSQKLSNDMRERTRNNLKKDLRDIISQIHLVPAIGFEPMTLRV